MEGIDGLETFRPGDRSEWRSWLERNHASSPGVWLVLGKKGRGRERLMLDEAVEEALAFGWIDSRQQPIDDDSFALRFTERKPGGTWSRSNKRRVEMLIDSGLMTPAGLDKVEAARSDGSWEFLDDVDALVVPPDLARAFASSEPARRNYEGFTDSVKRQILYWIKTAKRPETRAGRVEETVRRAAENRSPFG